jgi:DNA-binding FadR family transcriptional regulator
LTFRAEATIQETGAAALARQLGKAILAGQYPPGAILPGELELALQFSASRNLVREALKSLAAKGLVEARKKAGTRVRARSEWQMLDRELLSWRLESGPEFGFAMDLLALREAVEPAAAAAAAVRQDEAGIAEIRRAFAQMVAAGADRQRFAAPDLSFHKAILAASGNEFMTAFGGMIEAALAAFIRISLRHREAPGPSIPLHEAVLTAIEAGDAEAARRAMLALLSRTRDNIEKDASR